MNDWETSLSPCWLTGGRVVKKKWNGFHQSRKHSRMGRNFWTLIRNLRLLSLHPFSSWACAPQSLHYLQKLKGIGLCAWPSPTSLGTQVEPEGWFPWLLHTAFLSAPSFYTKANLSHFPTPPPLSPACSLYNENLSMPWLIKSSATSSSFSSTPIFLNPMSANEKRC